MNDDKIISKINEALEILLCKDEWLLNNDLSEQSISHKLAEHLQVIFNEYDVDCEYNGSINDMYSRKKILLLTQKLKEHNFLKESEENDIEKEFTERAVFPDIIIHKRGTNDGNLCIIEIKKSTSKIQRDYDYLKLEAFTSYNNENYLKYQLGIFIVFHTINEIGFEIQYFQNGRQITL